MSLVRVQLSRAKGWRMPPNTVKVDRSTGYGNPFSVTEKLEPGTRVGPRYIAVATVEDAVECFREMLDCPGETGDAFRALIPNLRGKNLACWCKLGDPCHADVLLDLANRP
jgi:hypothetical protein